MAERPYLSIGEVLASVQEEFPDVTISKIRFLESQGLIDPERTPSGYRKFYPADVERLRFILREQKERFLPLKVIKDRLDSGDPLDAEAAVAVVEAPPVADTADSADGNGAPARVPVWMARAAAPTRSTSAGELQLSFDELAAAAGLSAAELRQLEEYGLVTGTTIGRATFYDGDDLVVAKTCGGLFAQGLEGRHLRAFRAAAEREAGLYEQVVLPLLKQRNPQARADAQQRLRELVRLGADLQQALLRAELRAYLA